MNQGLMCINSDAINRYGIMITTGALEKSLKTTYDKGVPLLIGHDFHKPIGWNVPFGLFIEPGLTRLLAKKMQATSFDDLKIVRNALSNYLGKTYARDFLPYEEEFISLIKDHITTDLTRIKAGCIAVIEEGLTTRVFPELFSNNDKDGLVPLPFLLKYFTYLGQGIFKSKDSQLTVFAHPFFRRSQSRFNNFHFHFLDDLMSLKDSTDIKIRISLDEDMIGFSPSYHETGELEFHYGPEYTDDIKDMKPGITRHYCNESDKRYYEVESSEFFWKENGNEKIFESEELRSCASPMDGIFHCRYIHSIYDLSKNEFVHFDGAIRSYDPNSMSERTSKSFIQFGKNAVYKKIFRVDGKLSLDKWKLLITHYYQGNPLIYEYFGLKEERNAFKVEPASGTRLEQLLPFEIKKEEGLKLLVSYHNIPEDFRKGRYVDIPDIMGSEKSKFYCIEKRVHEIKKILQSIGEDLDIPGDWVLVNFDDRYWNIPSIMHAGEDAAGKLTLTTKALIMLFGDMIDKKVDVDISISLAFEMNDRIVRISSYGHIQNQLYWLQHNFSFEHTEEALTRWVEEQRLYLNKFERNIESPMLGSITQLDGVLFIKRIPVLFDYELGETDKGLTITIRFPEDDETIELYNSNQIRPVLCIKTNKAIWTDTGEDYYASSRTRIGTSSTVTIADWEPLALYWTKG
jgi:hypothetical protein